ncbi:MAG: ABC transporter ATP-binding protein [Acidimicrobiales bacterium]
MSQPERPTRRRAAGQPEVEGALSILRRGLRRSPRLRQGLVVTLLMGLSVALGRLMVPLLLERAIANVEIAEGQASIDVGRVLPTVAVAAVVILVSAVVSWATQRRLVVRAEETIADLRSEAFRRIHSMSIAEHTESRRGVLVARVTSDAEALARFVNWGLYSWAIQPTVIIGTFVVLVAYSWQIGVVVLASFAPVVPAMRWLQRGQLRAYDQFRTRVGEMLAGFAESVSGSAVIRAYGAHEPARRRLSTSIGNRYRARLVANRYMAAVFVVGDVFGAIALSLTLVLGIRFRGSWGLDAGELTACLFLVTLLIGPVAELGETLDQTQTAVAGWRKILDLLDQPIDLVEPAEGPTVPAGAIEVVAEGVDFAYRAGPMVLHDVGVTLPAGATVAIVGETGSGKTTFAKLLCRLADPTAGRIRFSGIDIADLGPDARHRAVRMVPQDGFLFDTTVGDNIRFGRPDATDADIEAAFERLGLTWWLERLPDGLASAVGERGGTLSVGERQLVALVRAALADPGLLILDEATSAVDPETDAALTAAIRRLAEGRTLVSIAHRLATAEAADLVLVFDAGRLVEQGSHDDLVDAGGPYSALHAAWVGNTSSIG